MALGTPYSIYLRGTTTLNSKAEVWACGVTDLHARLEVQKYDDAVEGLRVRRSAHVNEGSRAKGRVWLLALIIRTYL